jgi:hypothetical protein
MIMNALNLLLELMTFIILVLFMVLILKYLPTALRPLPLYLDVPKKEWNKYHAPYKDTVNCVPARITEVCTVDRILPEPYIEKITFPVKVKEHSMLTSVINKSAKNALEPDEQITVKHPNIVTKSVEDGHIIFYEDASNIVSHPRRSRKTSVHVLSFRIGDHCYYGLCNIGAVRVLFLMRFTERSCMKLVLVNLKKLMWLFSLLIEKLSLRLVLLEM